LSAIAEFDLHPTVRYCRRLDGADFSLEANTEAVPEEGHFYVLHHGEVELESDRFSEAMTAYQGLCREYWCGRLDSDQPEQRMASAWGLIGLEPENKAAAEVIRHDGSVQDQKRLQQIRARRRFARRRTGPFGRPKRA
jgi:hypothetical protein